MEITVQDLPKHEKMLVIGNPPFGTRSTLAKNFIKHSIDLGAVTIAFILPNTFKKLLNQKMFNDDWRLVDILETPDDHFLLEGEEIHIPCSFFVWTKLTDYKKDINLRDIKQLPAKEFIFLPRESPEADFCINGNNGKVKNVSEVINPKAEHYIKVTDSNNIETIRKDLSKINYVLESSVNGGVAWLGQNDILKAWHNK